MGILSDDSNGSDSKSCPTVAGENTQFDKGTSHNTLLYLTAACAAITLLVSVALIAQHLRRYRVPKEQRQIVKIVFVPVVYVAMALGTISNYHVAEYIVVIGDFYASWCLAALFLLYVQFAAPGAKFGDDMFNSLLGAVEKARKGDNASWPKITWICVFQYPVTMIISIIVLEATTASGTYCSASLRPKFGHLWTTIIKTIGVAVCVISIIRFYGRMKTQMKVRRAMLKLLCFKGIVALTFIQTWLFSILIDKEVLKPSKSLTYGDLLYGVPNTLIAVEMVLFSIGFWFAFSASEYSSTAKPNDKPMNFFLAFLNAINPLELILGILRIPSVLGSSRNYNPGAGYGMQNASYARVTDYGNGGGQYERGASIEEGAGPYAQPGPRYDAPAPPYGTDDYHHQSHLLTQPRSSRSPSPRRGDHY